jgi:HAD superfamily hydrolase (TIGR01484 family)
MMLGTYKLLLLDLDGTTVASKGDALPTERVIHAVRQAQKSVHVAVATGRPLPFAQSVTDALRLHGPSVFNGGAEIIDLSTGKTLHRKSLSVAKLQELVKICLPFGYEVATDADQYKTAIAGPDDIKSDAAKLFIGAVPTSDAVHLLEELAAVPGAAAHPTTSWTDGDVVDIHITHEHATKRYGVEKLISILGCTRAEVLAIGDGHNDLPLLEVAGFKVAMGNAPDEIKAVADYVAPPLSEDGVAETLERYIL